MADQTSGYAIVCCTYSGSDRSCTWRVKMAIETVKAACLSCVFSFHLDLLSDRLFHEAASTFMTDRTRNLRRWNGSLTYFVSKLLGLYKTLRRHDRPYTWNLEISTKVKALINDRRQQARPRQVVKSAWFTVVRTPASLAHRARSCMYCRQSGTVGDKSWNQWNHGTSAKPWNEW
jgi:hypothetical protein